MQTRGIRYKSGYKYQLFGNFYQAMLPVAPGESIFDFNQNAKTVKYKIGRP